MRGNDALEARRRKAIQKSKKLLEEIEKIKNKENSKEDLPRIAELRKDLEYVQSELEEVVNELEVEHFLEFGPGGKDIN